MSDGAEIHEASCSCGQLQATVTGPLGDRVSICHCLACQRRTGSPFGEQIRLNAEQVQVSGEATEWTRRPDDGPGSATFRFCPTCGATVYYTFEDMPEWIIIPVGALADPTLPAPIRSVWEERRHAWVVIPDTVRERMD